MTEDEKTRAEFDDEELEGMEIRAERKREVDERRKDAVIKMHQIMQTGQTLTGRVKHVAYNNYNEMAYGFITPDDSALDDLFVHHSEIEPWREGFKELKTGDVVKFKVSKGAGRNSEKWQAVNVEIDRAATLSRPPFRSNMRREQQPYRGKRNDGSDDFNR